MEDYQIETLAKIRELYACFERISDEDLCDLYHKWSHNNYFAGWIEGSDSRVELFCQWAITPPYLYEGICY